VDDYSEAIRLEPKDAGFHTGRGHALFQLRRFPSALADYDQAVALDPKNAEAHANRGDAHRSLGNWELAADDFRQAIELNINLGRAYQSAAWLMATCPDTRYRNPPLAVRAAEKALALDGNQDYIYLDTLAAAYASSGQFERAQETIRRAIQRAPAENLAPLKQRLSLYATQKPFHQEPAPATTARATKPPVR
jgi:tetratricopeptide (TPR) repeat protein